MRLTLQSLRAKLALSHLAVILVAMTAMSFALLSLVAGYFYTSVQQDLIAQAQLITTTLSSDFEMPASDPALSPSFNPVQQQQIGNLSVQVERQEGSSGAGVPDTLRASNLSQLTDISIALHAGLDTHIRVVDETSLVLVDSDSVQTGAQLEDHPGLAAALQGEIWHGREVHGDQPRMSVAVPLLQDELPVGAILLEQPLEGVRAILADIRTRLFLATALALPLSVGAGWALAHSLARPLRELTHAADHMSRGDYGYPLQGEGNDEIAQLRRAFLAMRGRLATTERSRTQFVSDVSHELRTPLTAIKGLIETLMDGAVEDAQVRDRFLDAIDTETDRLIRLVNDLLVLTRADAEALSLNLERIDLPVFLNHLLSKWRPVAASEGVHLSLNPQAENRFIQADPDRLEQVMVIALDNAIKHSHTEGEVRISVERAPRGTVGPATDLPSEAHAGPFLRVRVKDNGVGIPPEAVGHVFERFYRADPARDRRRGGSGLGLSIAKALMEAQHGTIHIQSPPDEPLPGGGPGTELILDLPAVH